MPVRLDNIPAQAEPPSPPGFWSWLGLLVVLLLVGLGLTIVLGGEALSQQSAKFWRISLGIPLGIWLGLLVVRVMWLVLQQGEVDGFNDQRHLDLTNRMRQGRRVLQVVATSLYTALHEEGEDGGERQGEALLGNRSALKSQAVRGGEGEVFRHSQLPESITLEGAPEADKYLLNLYRRVLADLAAPLGALPATHPLALLLETEGVPNEEQQVRAWAQAWREVGILQEAVPIEGSGLSAIDHWLDDRSTGKALLLVVAVRLVATEQDGAAEAATGLLLSNARQGGVTPLAYLHRPEQERLATSDGLLAAARQGLIWAALPVESVEHVWVSGVAATRQPHVTDVLTHLPCKVKLGLGLYDLGSSLGHAGCAAPWAAIAAATDAVRFNARPQFIFSGATDAEQMLWCTAITGTSPSSA